MSDTGERASSSVTYAEDINRQQQDKDVQSTEGLCLSDISSSRTNNNNFTQTDRLAGSHSALDVLMEGAPKTCSEHEPPCTY